MNKPELTDEKIKRRINDIEDRRSASRDFWGGDYEYPEDIELMALRELQELRRSYLALRGEIEDVQAQLYEAENRNEADDTELQESRKADSAEPVSFDELNAAVAEVTGGNQHAWNASIYKGHQAVPFMNYNSLARIVDKYRAPQPVPVVPDEKTDRDYVTDCHGLPSIEDCGHQRGWNACRAAMLQGADRKPELAVWYGAMPETNGKTNWTAILHRKGHHLWEGITIDRSEYPDRVRYEADRMRYLIGDLVDEPDILAYDADAHSGYVSPAAMLQAGSHLVIGIDRASGPDRTGEVRYCAPPGYVMVPVEPTEKMVIEGFESEPDEFFSKSEEWDAYQEMSGCEQAAHRAKLCWAAMIKAAPKQENI